MLGPSKGIKEGEAIAESFFQLGLLVGAAESEIHSCYTTGREKRKKSQVGIHSKYQKHEPILLRHLAYYYLGIYKEHVDAVLTFNEETGEDMQSDSFRRFYRQFKKGEKLSWHFIAPMVHDFSWAADPNFTHDIVKTEQGTELHFLYKNIEKYRNAWKEVQALTVKALNYYNKNIGEYPYRQYSVIQAGDGGMEYAMSTFILGGVTLNSIRGTIFHELAHSWFQHVLATNESKHSWLDEGFTTYISTLASNEIIRGEKKVNYSNDYYDYFYAVKYGLEEPLTTHADRFNTNAGFSIGSYTKGSMFLSQLNYIIGEENTQETIKKYYSNFKFKHPTPNDFKRTAEIVSLKLTDVLNNPLTENSLKNSISIYNIETLKEMSTLNLHDFGIYLELEPDEEEKAELTANISMALQTKEIDLADAFKPIDETCPFRF
mgnify:CR=1 FL=1